MRLETDWFHTGPVWPRIRGPCTRINEISGFRLASVEGAEWDANSTSADALDTDRATRLRK